MDDEKAKAKFDKAKHVLTVTLPVVPPPLLSPRPFTPPQQTPLISELHLDAIKQEDVHSAEDKGGKDEQCEDKLSEEEETSLEPSGGSSRELNEGSEPVVCREGEWSSTGEWTCPPFSYRQEDSTVVFCLHTAGVRETTLVKHFDEHYVSARVCK